MQAALRSYDQVTFGERGQCPCACGDAVPAGAPDALRGRGGAPGDLEPSFAAVRSPPTGGEPAPKTPSWNRLRRPGFQSWASSSCWRRRPPSLMRWFQPRIARTLAARLRCC